MKDGLLRVHVQQHKLDVAILALVIVAIVIVKERSRYV